jgi:hypothetical protein
MTLYGRWIPHVASHVFLNLLRALKKRTMRPSDWYAVTPLRVGGAHFGALHAGLLRRRCSFFFGVPLHSHWSPVSTFEGVAAQSNVRAVGTPFETPSLPVHFFERLAPSACRPLGLLRRHPQGRSRRPLSQLAMSGDYSPPCRRQAAASWRVSPSGASVVLAPLVSLSHTSIHDRHPEPPTAVARITSETAGLRLVSCLT